LREAGLRLAANAAAKGQRARVGRFTQHGSGTRAVLLTVWRTGFAAMVAALARGPLEPEGAGLVPEGGFLADKVVTLAGGWNARSLFSRLRNVAGRLLHAVPALGHGVTI